MPSLSSTCQKAHAWIISITDISTGSNNWEQSDADDTEQIEWDATSEVAFHGNSKMSSNRIVKEKSGTKLWRD